MDVCAKTSLLRGVAAAVALACLLASAGCRSGPGELEVFDAPAPAEAPPLPRYSVRLEAVAGAAGLRLPLPASDRQQRLESLLWLAPQGKHRVEGDESARVLCADPATRVSLRARFALDQRERLSEQTREALAEFPREPDAFLKAARAARRSARLVWGIRWRARAEGERSEREGPARIGEVELMGQLTRWAEVRERGDGPWVPVELGASFDDATPLPFLRLGSEEPRGVEVERLVIRREGS